MNELPETVNRSIKTKVDQEIQLDWSKIDRSKFCDGHKDRKENIKMETYWEKKELEEATKDTWARIRCGSVGKESQELKRY